MKIEIHKKKKSLLVSMQTFLARHTLMVDGVEVPLNPTTITKHLELGYCAEMIRYGLIGKRKIKKEVAEKLIKAGFPTYISRLYAEKQKNEATNCSD